MRFLSAEFIVFLVALLCVLQLTGGNIKARNSILLVASYLFYSIGDFHFLLLLITLSCIVWWCGKKIKETGKSQYFRLGIAAALLSLVFFKYFNFFADTLGSFLGISLYVRHLLFPLGISFYTFQAISYLCDVKYGKIEAEVSLVNMLLYIGFFPQIVSGPIVKAHDFLPQLYRKNALTGKRLSYGIQKFALGICKKVVIADRLGVAVDTVYAASSAYSGLSLLLTAVAFSLQIYYDFSGYSDMATGVAHMLGFDFGENFNLPYLASNPSEFWKRWHISLSSWFRDYVYIPLGGNKKGRMRTYINLSVTMLLSGLWHGAGWTFILWGMTYAILSVIYKMYAETKLKNILSLRPNRIRKTLSVILMSGITTIMWIPFRAESLSQARRILTRIFTLSPGVTYIYIYTVIFLIMLCIVQGISVKQHNTNDIWQPLDLKKFKSKIIFCCFLLIIVMFGYIGDGVFIYAQF